MNERIDLVNVRATNKRGYLVESNNDILVKELDFKTVVLLHLVLQLNKY